VHIYLLRHGIAEDAGPGVSDHDRALTPEGHKRLRRAMSAWRRLVAKPDVVITSPLRRARETADLFVEAARFAGELRIDEALAPNAAPSLAMSLLEAEVLSATNAIALIGHEPHLGYLLGTLLTGHSRQAIPLKKGMLVAVETLTEHGVSSELRFALPQKAAAELV
jgi:phosphohistidine phosphatase